MKKSILATLLFCFVMCRASLASVKFDGQSFLIDGILLLQDAEDTNSYYYAPKAPTISFKNDSTPEFLFIKYVGNDEQSSGGLFHTLIEFTVSDEQLKVVSQKLRKQLPDARIKGRLPFLSSSGEGAEPSFEIISSTLLNTGEGGMTRSIVASGHAPLNPGSKAAVAALLDQRGATLLMNSFTSGPVSDLSIGIKAYYEATLPSFNATITADLSRVYSEFINSSERKTLFSSSNIRQRIDTLIRKSAIKIDVVDRSQAFNIDNVASNALVELIATKITDMLFITAEGEFPPEPIPEPAPVDPGMGAMGMDPMMMMMMMGGGGAAGGAGKAMMGAMVASTVLTSILSNNKKNYELKKKDQVSFTKIKFSLNRTSSIKIPFYTSGNLSLFYDTYKKDNRCFKVVNMNDPAFQRREIPFQVDADFVDAFDDLLNFVTVKFRKTYADGQEEFRDELMISKRDIDAGYNLKVFNYPRLGEKGSDWTKYEYQVIWSLKGKNQSIRQPENENEWINSNAPAISLIPPLVKEEVIVDADRDLFQQNNYSSAQINFGSTIGGIPTPSRKLILRSADSEWGSSIVIYHDPNQPIVYQTTWYSNIGENKEDLKRLTSNYLNIVPIPLTESQDDVSIENKQIK